MCLNDDCFHLTAKQNNESKNKQVGLHPTKKLRHSKGNNQQKNPPNRRKYLQITPNKGLICKIHKEFIQLSNKKSSI